MTEQSGVGGGSPYERIGPDPSRLQVLFVVGILAMFALLPLAIIYPSRPATWVGWLLLYGVVVPLSLIVAVVTQIALTVAPIYLVWGRPRSVKHSTPHRVLQRLLFTVATVVSVFEILWLKHALGALISDQFVKW